MQSDVNIHIAFKNKKVFVCIQHVHVTTMLCVYNMYMLPHVNIDKNISLIYRKVINRLRSIVHYYY